MFDDKGFSKRSKKEQKEVPLCEEDQLKCLEVLYRLVEKLTEMCQPGSGDRSVKDTSWWNFITNHPHRVNKRTLFFKQ